MSGRAGEARMYWCAVKSARDMRHSQVNCDTSEQREDLELLLIHSTWQQMRQKAIAFLLGEKEATRENFGC